MGIERRPGQTQELSPEDLERVISGDHQEGVPVEPLPPAEPSPSSASSRGRKPSLREKMKEEGIA